MQKTEGFKTTCNNFPVGPIIPIPAKVVADVSGVSESYVKKLRSTDRGDKSEKAQKIIKAEMLLNDAVEVAVNEVKRLINK